MSHYTMGVVSGRSLTVAFAVCILAATLVPRSALARNSDLPANFEQILPRGRIAVITQPQYVSATEAEISDNSWVLGVVIDGQGGVRRRFRDGPHRVRHFLVQLELEQPEDTSSSIGRDAIKSRGRLTWAVKQSSSHQSVVAI